MDGLLTECGRSFRKWAVFWRKVYEFPLIHIVDFENLLVENQHFFLIYRPKDSPYSCDHFHIRPLVVGGHLRRRNPRKQQKNAINYICFVTSSMTSALWVIYHLKALDLNFDIPGRLSSATTWWRSRANWTKTLKSRYDSNMTHNIFAHAKFSNDFFSKMRGRNKIFDFKFEFSIKFCVGQYVMIWGLYWYYRRYA